MQKEFEYKKKLIDIFDLAKFQNFIEIEDGADMLGVAHNAVAGNAEQRRADSDGVAFCGEEFGDGARMWCAHLDRQHHRRAPQRPHAHLHFGLRARQPVVADQQLVGVVHVCGPWRQPVA